MERREDFEPAELDEAGVSVEVLFVQTPPLHLVHVQREPVIVAVGVFDAAGRRDVIGEPSLVSWLRGQPDPRPASVPWPKEPYVPARLDGP